MIELPVVEIKELFDGITVANVGAMATPIMDNVHVEFSHGKIWGTMTRSLCQQQHVIDYAPTDHRLDNLRILIPYKQVNQLLSLGIDEVELILNGDNLRYINRKTVVNLQLEDIRLYPKVTYHDGDVDISLDYESLKSLLSVRVMCIQNGIKAEYEKVLIAKEKNRVRSFVFAHSAMPCVSLVTEEPCAEPVFFEITDSVASVVLGRIKPSMTIYLSNKENGSTIISTSTWVIIDNSIKTSLSSMYKALLSKAVGLPIAEYYIITIAVSELKRAIRISDITGYEVVSEKLSNRTFKLSISPQEVFVVNDKSDYGISSKVHIPTKSIVCDTEIERTLSFIQVKDFLSICTEESVTINLPKNQEETIVLICDKKRLITMPVRYN